MKTSSAVLVSGILLFLIVLTGCTTDSGYNIQEPTFDSVPEPFDISEAEEEPVIDGVTRYIVEEGRGEDTVVIRDQVALYLTLRTEDGTIIYSSYQNDNTNPIQASVQNISTPTPPNVVNNFNFDRARTDGLRKGLIGMREGEKRVLIVPPSQGFESIGNGSINAEYRDETLRYDIELDFIY